MLRYQLEDAAQAGVQVVFRGFEVMGVERVEILDQPAQRAARLELVAAELELAEVMGVGDVVLGEEVIPDSPDGLPV